MENNLRVPTSQQLHQALQTDGIAILQGERKKDTVLDFACSTVAGLSDRPRRLDCRFLYDANGSALFEQITQQPEYYLTRTETELLAAHSDSIREIVGPTALFELGSGSSTKSELILDAWLTRDNPVRYVPVDVSETALTCACKKMHAAHSSLEVVGVNCEYAGAFPILRELSPVLVFFLGSSIGNFAPGEMDCFLNALAASLNPDDFFLVGVDLVKECRIIEAAYNDAAGVTARFTRNIFARMNRELGSAVNLKGIRHVARYLPEQEQVEIHARFTRSQTIEVRPLEKSFHIPAGEEIGIEICRKFSLERFLPYLEGHGFTAEAVYTDPKKWFALVLLRRSHLMSPAERAS